MARWLSVAGACVVLFSIVAGCSRDQGLAEASYIRECAGVTARVWIPINEPRSVGTYRIEIESSDGSNDQTEARRDGMITGVWLADLEADGTLELVVATSSAGSGTYGSADVYRYREGRLATLKLRPLDDAQRLGYMGHDVYSVADGRLHRSYPLYQEGDPNAAPSGGTARLWYSFGDSAWVSEGETP